MTKLAWELENTDLILFEGNQIKIGDLELEARREILSDPEQQELILSKINDLQNLVFDFSTKEGVKEAKALKTQANAFVKKLKEACDPLEEEGRRISKIRSNITTALTSGQNAVIEKILAPVTLIEKQIKELKAMILEPINDLFSIDKAESEIEQLKNMNWLAFKDEAEPLIEQYSNMVVATKIKLEEEKRLKEEVERKAREEREEQIRKEVEEKAKIEAEKRIEEERKFAEEREKQLKIQAEKEKEEAIKRESEKLEAIKQAEIKEEKKREDNEQHRNKIQEEIILQASQYCNLEDRNVQCLLEAIFENKISNLIIKY